MYYITNIFVSINCYLFQCINVTGTLFNNEYWLYAIVYYIAIEPLKNSNLNAMCLYLIFQYSLSQLVKP